MSSYWRQLFTENPKWLKAKRNKEVLARYRADHNIPEDTPIDKKQLQALANTKSNMRKQKRRRGRRAAEEAAAQGLPVKKVRIPQGLEKLEIAIDDAMMLARSLDAEGLHDVWRQLRHARNQVVLKMG
jgi:hypothetical protein